MVAADTRRLLRFVTLQAAVDSGKTANCRRSRREALSANVTEAHVFRMTILEVLRHVQRIQQSMVERPALVDQGRRLEVNLVVGIREAGHRHLLDAVVSSASMRYFLVNELEASISGGC